MVLTTWIYLQSVLWFYLTQLSLSCVRKGLKYLKNKVLKKNKHFLLYKKIIKINSGVCRFHNEFHSGCCTFGEVVQLFPYQGS